MRRHHFGVVGMHSGGSDHRIRTSDIFGVVAHMGLDAQAVQALQCSAV